MITVATGGDVAHLLKRVSRTPEAFSTLTVCSPFIGVDEGRELIELMLRADVAGCGVRVITIQGQPQCYSPAPACIPPCSGRQIRCASACTPSSISPYRGVRALERGHRDVRESHSRRPAPQFSSSASAHSKAWMPARSS